MKRLTSYESTELGAVPLDAPTAQPCNVRQDPDRLRRGHRSPRPQTRRGNRKALPQTSGKRAGTPKPPSLAGKPKPGLFFGAGF